MSSPHSTRPVSPDSTSSSPSSRFSELSAATSQTDDSHSNTLHAKHLLVISPPCRSPTDLATYLRILPLDKNCESAKSYLLLAFGLDDGIESGSQQDLTAAVHKVGSILGNSSMFDAWTFNKSAGYFESAGAGECSVVNQVVSPTKLSHNDVLNAFASAGLHLVCCTSVESGKLYLLQTAPFSFPSLSPLSASGMKVNAFGPPTREEWRTLWSAWDLVTQVMIPSEMLHQKPIDLRHKCLFYIGHIPTFLNILLSRLLKEPYTEPKSYTQIFERGIDPHVDDPNYCHSHSEVPEVDEDWPILPEILAYRDRIRERLMQLYDDIDSGKRKLNRSLGRVLQMTLEHEAFHIETLLYMLIQRAGSGTIPPPGFTTPPWEALAEQWRCTPVPSSASVTLGPATLVMGHDDAESDDALPELADDVLEHAFGWDNESPRREIELPRFRVDWRPISNGEFLVFWKHSGVKGDLPGSWVEKDDQILVRTVHGPVPMSVAEHWPVLASYDQLQSYAQSKGGRIPTEPELRLFLDTYEVDFDGGANVGFRNWHPVPATAGCDNKPGSNGGVWEWTSTVFDEHLGMSPTKHFPGYSTDFFDGKHQVVLGASYATIPRLAGRRTVRNFYQHNYPYAWVGARVAYDD